MAPPRPKTIDHLRKHAIEGKPAADMTDRRCGEHRPLSAGRARPKVHPA
jgi:hypothetical protein